MKTIPITTLALLLLTALPTLSEPTNPTPAKDEKAAKQIANLKEFVRLGETKADFEKRSGKPLRPDAGDGTLYRQAGLSILATFWKDKSANLIIFKQDPALPDGEFAKLTDTEIQALLTASQGNSTWKPDTEHQEDGIHKFIRTDKKATASYDPEERHLIITDSDFEKHIADEEK